MANGLIDAAILCSYFAPEGDLVVKESDSMKWLEGLAPMTAALAVAWALGATGSCQGQPAPPLLQVVELAPKEVETGDTLSIAGVGFPTGRTARVSFRGTLRRPGERPVTDAEIVVSGSVVDAEHVEVPFDESNESLFSGAGDVATHTAFEGTVEVAFAAAVQGASPIVGALEGVTLDVRPAAGAADRARQAEGERSFAWLGLHAAPASPSGVGVLVASVDNGSRAQVAGIAAGDTLVRFDGLRVASAADVLPAPGEREAIVNLRRPGTPYEIVRSIAVSGFRRALPTELLGGALFVFAALAVVLFFALPLPPLAAALRRAASRTRARLPLPAGTAAVADAVAGALLAVMPFGQYLVAAQLDVGILFCAAVGALVAAAFVGAGTLWQKLGVAAHVVWQHVPGAVVVVGVVVTTGSLRIQEIERAQGGAPWDWLAFRNPGTLLALGLLLSCALVEPEDGLPAWGSRLLALADLEREPSRVRGAWGASACRAHKALLCGLACALFLGGWRLPGLLPAEQDSRATLELAGAACLLFKTWGLLWALSWVRLALPFLFLQERTRAVAVWLAPLSLASLAASAAYVRWSPARPTQLLVSGCMLTVVVLTGAAAVTALASLRSLSRRLHQRSPGYDPAYEYDPSSLSAFL
jgi:NADH-quinone oxidoreductase subunit H